MNENEKQDVGWSWRTQDWIWLVGVLIAIMILMIADFYNSEKIEFNFSIISSAVSIALGLVAIFIALKQDSDNQSVNHTVNGKLEKIANDLKNVDDKVDNVISNILTNVAKTAENFSPDGIVEEKESYTQQDLERIINHYTNQIEETLNTVVSNKQSDVSANKITIYKQERADMLKLPRILNYLRTKCEVGQQVSTSELMDLISECGDSSERDIIFTINRLKECGIIKKVSSKGKYEFIKFDL